MPSEVWRVALVCANFYGVRVAQEQQALVDSLATLLQSCGFVQDPNAGRKSFDGVKVSTPTRVVTMPFCQVSSRRWEG